MESQSFFTTERRNARRQQDRDLADFFTNATFGLAWVGIDGIVLWTNQYQLDLLGYSADEIIGHHVSKLYKEPHLIREMLADIRKQQSLPDRELQQKTKNGSIRHVLASCNGFWEHGQFIHARFFIRDITEQKKGQEIIRRQREELKLITDTVPALMAFIDRDQRYRFNNDTYRKWFNEDPATIRGKHVRDVIGTQSYEDIRPHLEKALAGTQTSYETLVLFRNGERRHFSGTYTPRFDKQGNVIGVVSIATDITAQKEVEQKIMESERRFHALADAAPVMIWTAQPNQERDYFNKSWLAFTGRELGGIVGTRWLDDIHPEDREHFIATYRESFKTHQQFRIESRLRHHDGQYRWILCHGAPRFTNSGRFIGYIGSAVDIHDRKQFEDRVHFLAETSQILYSSLDYETTLQNLANLVVPKFADWCTVNLVEADHITTTAVAHRDPEKVTWAQKLGEKYPIDPHALHGVAKVIRTGVSEFIPHITEASTVTSARDPEHHEILTELGLRSVMIAPLKVQNRTLGAISFVSAESGRQYVHDDLLFAEELARAAAIAVDNARLYQRLRESDNAKTQFLSMLAHELRNPMAPILSSLQFLEFQSRQTDHATNETVRLMERQIKQMSRLLDDLLDVSRIVHGKIVLARKEIDLNSIVAYAIETTRPLKEERSHTLSVSLPSHPVRVIADPVRIEQIIVNLLNNAYKYTEPRGTVWLTLTQQNNGAVVRVKDNGTGIAPHMLSKIFDLFSQGDHSLSRAFGGMGIGLTLVKSLTEMHNGTIKVESAGIGKGSEFIVRLPTSPEVVSEAQPYFDFGTPASESSIPERMSQKILIVDDNRDAAHALGRLLERLGHEINYAYSGNEALLKAAEYQPGVILLDIGLPEISGYDVARKLRQDPLLKNILLVAVSGYGQEEDRLRSREAGFDHHFTKPIGVEKLTEIL